jgi:hypothetical protein
MCLVMASIRSLTHSNLIISECCKWTDKFNWRSQTTVRSYEVPLIKVKIECHVFLVVSVKRLNVFLKI